MAEVNVKGRTHGSDKYGKRFQLTVTPPWSCLAMPKKGRAAVSPACLYGEDSSSYKDTHMNRTS